jgi:hypothetical protein
MAWPSHRHREPESRLSDYIAEGRTILARAVELPASPTVDEGDVGPDFEALRWFLLPEDVAAHA